MPGIDVLGERQAGGLAQYLVAHARADQERFLMRQGVGLQQGADGGSVMAPADRLDLAVEGAVEEGQEIRALGVRKPPRATRPPRPTVG